MSQDRSADTSSNTSARPLPVRMVPAPDTVVVASDDPLAATVRVHVVRVPASEVGADRAPSTPSAGSPDPASLPDDPAVLKQMIAEL